MRDPIEPLFPQSLLDALRQSPGSPAFEQGDRSVSRGELLDLIGRLAGAMRRAGLGPGRGIAVHLAVSPEAFAAHIAAHVLGCRVVAVRPRYAAGQLAHVLGMDVDYVLVDATTVETSTAALLTAPEPAPLLSLGPCPSAIDLLAQPGDGGDLRVTARPDDVAALVFTSGSTGRPKGCAITYRALSSHWTWQPRAWSPAAAEFAMAFERYLLFGTLASMVVLEFLAPCLLGGGTAVIPDDDGRSLFPYAIERYRITGSIITVPRLSQMLDVLRRQQVDVGSLRALMVSGSPISPRRLAAAVERLGPVVYQGYGQTEAGNIAMLTPTDIAAGPDRVLGSVGRPHPQVEVSVRDEAEREVDRGRTGEIYVRAPYQMTRYWGQEEETHGPDRAGAHGASRRGRGVRGRCPGRAERRGRARVRRPGWPPYARPRRPDRTGPGRARRGQRPPDDHRRARRPDGGHRQAGQARTARHARHAAPRFAASRSRVRPATPPTIP